MTLLCSGYQNLTLLYLDQVKIKGEGRKDSHSMTMNRLEFKNDWCYSRAKKKNNTAATHSYFNWRNICLAGVTGFLMIHQWLSSFFQYCSPLKFPAKVQDLMELNPTSKTLTSLAFTSFRNRSQNPHSTVWATHWNPLSWHKEIKSSDCWDINTTSQLISLGKFSPHPPSSHDPC